MTSRGQCIMRLPFMRLQFMLDHLHSSILDIGLATASVDMTIMAIAISVSMMVVIVVFVGMMVAIMVVIVAFVAMAVAAATGKQPRFTFNVGAPRTRLFRCICGRGN
ncbi:MAG: hypothetical protein HHJ09_05110 [Glaciimonas sp.]|nr:hypothetical protein [Glaciimonas sp.]